MAALPKYALGREEKVFVVPETTYGAAASAPAGTDAIRFRTMGLTQKEDRVQRDDHRATRSYLATIVRRLSTEWNLHGYLLPSGAAGTAPDGWDVIFKAAFGTETVNAATSVVYTLAKEFERTFTMHRGIGRAAASSIFSEMARGCVVDKLSFALSSQDEAQVTASGFAADVLRAGTSLTVGTDTGTSFAVTSGEGHNFDAGTYIDIGSAAGVLISAVNTGTDTLTVASHSVQSSGSIVSPSACNTSETYVSTSAPISGILGSCTYDGGALEIISANVDLVNAAKPHNDKYGANKNTSFHLGNRMVTGSINMRLHEDNFLTVAKTRRSSTIALTLVAGTTAGSIATFSLPTVVVDYSMVPSVAADDIIVSLPFIAYGSSGEDELSLTFT
jgi:hypothetical protein